MNKDVEKYTHLIWSIGIISGIYLLYVLFNVELDNNNRKGLLLLIGSFFLIMCSLILESEKMLEYCHCLLWITFFIVLLLSNNKYIISFLTVLHIFILLSWKLNSSCILGSHSDSKLNIKFENTDVGLCFVETTNIIVILYGFYVIFFL